MKELSVVVCTKNEEKYIGPCLRRLAEQEVPCEIIVVDAHSTDRTLEIAKRYADRIVFDHGRGISDARNVGWKAASCGTVAYCDCDAFPPKDWTRKILKHMEGLYCVSGPMIPYDGRMLVRINFNIWGNLFPRLMSRLGYQSVWGANMAFRRSVLEKYPFGPRFLEDYDMGIRLRKTFRIKFYGDMKMPVSSRRFENGVLRTCIKYYLREWVKRKTGRATDTSGYFK